MSTNDFKTLTLMVAQSAQTDAPTLSAGNLLAGGVVWTGGIGGDYYTGTEFDDSLDGGGGNDFIWGGAGNDTLIGGSGFNYLYGGEGSDTYRTAGSWYDTIIDDGTSGTDTVILTGSELTLTANAGIEVIIVENSNVNMGVTVTGDASNNLIIGHDGTDRLNGGAGADTLQGGKGWDVYYVDNAGDVIVEAAGEGTDVVYASVSYVIADGVEVEELKAAEGTANINLTGNASTWVLVGNAGNNILDGGTGADDMTGGAGDDTYIVDNAGDYIHEVAGEGKDTVISSVDYTLAANADIEVLKAAEGTVGIKLTGNALDNLIVGNAGANSLFGGEGADTLDGGAGNDVLTGGAGDDTYMVDSSGDDIIEAADGGHDTVIVSGSFYSLNMRANIEDLQAAAGSGAITLYGNTLNNKITGGDGNDVLDGRDGVDTLIGGKGDDKYWIETAGDLVIEAAGEGRDEIYINYLLNYTLAADCEIEVLWANSYGNHLLVGNAFQQEIHGLWDDDTLDGGGGGDRLIDIHGGSDTYRIRSIKDVIQDADYDPAAKGIDTAEVFVSAYAIAEDSGIEILKVGDGYVGNVTLIGNSLDNTIQGSAGNDTLVGNGGADLLEGGAGNDTYYIDADDVVNDTGGIDTLVVSFNYTLASDSAFENLTAGGTDALVLTGNSLANTITGNAANNTLVGNEGDDVLNGGAGNDRMDGGSGNDTYYVNSKYDTVVETATGGSADIVYSSASYTLSAYVEKLFATGSGAISLTGNNLANTITGNTAGNTLKGGSGNDMINGSKGNDVLYGGTGKDKFVFNSALSSKSNKDLIKDWSAKDDTIQLENAIFKSLKTTGMLSKAYFVLGAVAKDSNDYVGYDKATGNLWYDANGKASGGQVIFANIGKDKVIAYNDFYVI